jgi:predicted nucleotidyltransferase
LFGQRLPLTGHLSELFRRTVEVIPEHELNRHIRDQVLREAVEL